MALLCGANNVSVLSVSTLTPLPFPGLCFSPMYLPLPPAIPSFFLPPSLTLSFSHSPSSYAQHV